MTNRKNCVNLLLIVVLGLLPLGSVSALPADSVTLYTPYTNISVPPGQAINYSIDAINNSKRIQHLNIAVEGLSRSWTSDLKSGGWDISQLSILPGQKEELALSIGVPLKINKGKYHFRVVANGQYTLPLVVTVSKQGTYKTEFSTTQPNMEGTSKTTFTYSATLQNMTADTELYALQAQVDPGWTVDFKVNYKQVSSVSVDPNQSQTVLIDVNPPEDVAAGTYTIPVTAQTSTTSASINLYVVITGSYKMALTTPTGLLSTNITAGGARRVQLVVQNTGSSQLQNVKLSAASPSKWDVTFDPKQIDQILPNGSAIVYATIKADKKAIPGDYQVDMTATTSQTSSSLTMRVTAETSMLWGWIGVLIIIIALGSVYFLFRKYGRR
ncbi:NEW3 domain-containing protein [Microbacter margulisiae]|uniref:Putative membrane protein n=1 Tax=Microbacter margulisiae TaxID=1350067 RepID=A0A7W5DPE1_9PORP|nr:NEW3 domain-containing protein [Microbacter margulisiae]MBB3185863.1 putative membrane protein [Microbacter margulisiae]